ncbi:MAG: DUF507 family protein [Alphaproteobacteria bacterium]|uniref:DUF507 family protein n=1 Tax=Candidatus Nitrobium versatile TaxID=2884831 RepID=A0A953J9V4_9BACT|nr:DUF507 family protein [Candidatus Nitrobium versatile]
MMLSDDKITHMTHVLLKGLMEKGLITLKEDDSLLRREIKRTIINELKAGEDIDGVVRKKLQSYSKKLVEGSPEWEVLYKKFFEEEDAKRGRR